MGIDIKSDRFVVQRMPMISGQGEAQQTDREYKIAVDPQGCIWLYCLNIESPGSAVYVHDPKDTRSDGFGGATLTFRVGKTGQYVAKGPWHSNSDALFSKTGVDLRDKHLTFGVIAHNRTSTGPPAYDSVLEGIIYADDTPKIGNFNRIEDMAQAKADELGKEVYYYSESSGGSSCGPVYPKGQAPWELAKAK